MKLMTGFVFGNQAHLPELCHVASPDSNLTGLKRRASGVCGGKGGLSTP